MTTPMTSDSEEVSYRCFIKGCKNFAFDNIGCAVHGNTLVRTVRTFRNGKMIKEEVTEPGSSTDGSANIVHA